MPILNGFLRGAHDEEITANIDQKQYQGVPVNTYNWIGTRRGGLSKRAPFKLQRTLDQESYIIPYSFDDDEKYLLQFYNGSDGKANYKVLRYTNGALIDSTFGGIPYVQPTFTSNNSEGHIISSKSLTTEQDNAYKAFSGGTVSASQTKTSLIIEFPQPVLLSTISYTYGQASSNQTSGAFQTVTLEITDTNGGAKQIGRISNTWLPPVFPVGGQGELTKSETSINPQSLFAKKLTLTFSDYWYNHEGASVNPNIGKIKLTGQVLTEKEEETSPFTYEQIQETNYYNSFRKLYFVHKDVKPQELALNFSEPTYSGLNLETLGNPTLVRVFQQRLVFGGFVNYPRQINLSKSAEYNTFQLNKTDTVATDPIEGAIDEMKSPLTALFSGRQMLYAQSIDGLGSLNSGADDVPLTATQVSARLRNETPLSKKIQPIKQDEIIFCVGADDKTVYALDYDYQYARIPLHQLNDHCMSYFDSGIKQMMQMKGKLPYIVFLLNDGSLIFAICYRDSTGFQFHAFPQKMADGIMLNMAVLRNTSTGNDALFGVVQHSNGQYSLESIESYTDFYTTQKGQDYFKSHVLLDMKQTASLSYNNNISFTYTGQIGDNGKRLFSVFPKSGQTKYVWSYDPIESDKTNDVYTLVPPEEIVAGTPVYDSETNEQISVSNGTTADYGSYGTGIAFNTSVPGIGHVVYRAQQFDIYADLETSYDDIKLLIDTKEITCTECAFDEDGNMWAYTSSEPSTEPSTGYSIPKRTFNMPEYIGLPVQAFNGDDFIEKESEDVNARTITFKRPMYSAEFGLPYKAYSEFINIVDANGAQYETVINSISACITYGTGIKLGTETALEKVGYSEYPYTQWQDKILPDESLKNVILNDRGVKNKRIVIECDFPFPANVTFITYDIKATGVK